MPTRTRAADPFQASPHLGGPGVLVAVTPNNSANLPTPVRAIICTGSAGNVKVDADGYTDADPLTVTLPIEVGVNERLDAFYIKKVHATDTTATGLYGVV